MHKILCATRFFYDKAKPLRWVVAYMNCKPNNPSFPLAQSAAERKWAKYEREASERQARYAYAVKVDADIAAGLLPPGSCRVRPGDTVGLRLEARRRRQERRDRRAIEKALKQEQKERWVLYERRTRALTEKQPLHLLRGIHLRGQGYALDHAVSVKAAFLAGWPVERAASITNLQIVPTSFNTKKGTECYSSLEARLLPIAA